MTAAFTEMHGLQTRRKHDTTHYLGLGWFMQKYGSNLVSRELHLTRINQQRCL